ncbi:major royal jelly domain-containing protein [Neurospora intermedia]|uniref:Major royal jelly domain-containing protein n=1 Tax=Neurospora intermedia TaxID=5142 RepID=A0ABR3D171_NEUIN
MARFAFTALAFLLSKVLAVNAGDDNNDESPYYGGDDKYPVYGGDDGDYDNNPYNFTFLADSGVYGPPLEVVHAYFGEWPNSASVSSTGRIFSNFPAIVLGNVNNGTPGVFSVAELTSPSTEEAYPSEDINTPPCPGGAVNLTDPANPVGCGSPDAFVSVQSVQVDAEDRLWILDTGRPIYTLPDGSVILVNSSYGGPKLVSVDLSTDTVVQTILFPEDVVFPDTSYIDDFRIDLNPSLSNTTGEGVAYITDTSLWGDNAIIVVDLGTGDSWRRLEGDPSVVAEPSFLPFIWGQPLYFTENPGNPPDGNLTTTTPAYLPAGVNGIALSADGETLFYTPLAGRNLYSVPTALLREPDDAVEAELAAAVVKYGNAGFSDGLETDPESGFIYKGSIEANAVVAFDADTGVTQTVVRDPRLGWVDSLSVAELEDEETGETQSWLYISSDQFDRSWWFWAPGAHSGDIQERPFGLFRVPLPLPDPDCEYADTINY